MKRENLSLGLGWAVATLLVIVTCTTCLWPATETTLYTFTGGNNGGYPLAGLVFDANGNLYGTTFFGGVFTGPCRVGCGTVFELTPNSGGGSTLDTLHRFIGGSTDAQSPISTLTFDSVGNLYGTGGSGGLYSCPDDFGFHCGAVFRLAPSGGGWNESLIFSFNGHNGYSPVAGIIFHNGRLFGTTQFGPTTTNHVGNGTVFRTSNKTLALVSVTYSLERRRQPC